MNLSKRIKTSLKELNLVIKFLILVSGGACFFILFPFCLKYGLFTYILFFLLLFIFGAVFRIVSERRAFRVILWLWASGSIIYLIIATFLIIKGVQPLPYLKMDRLNLIIYYISYPLRVLGIFFSGLIFAHITSPVEFLRWGRAGVKIALAYRAFEYSVNAFEENRIALLIQGVWPDFSNEKRSFKMIYMALKYAPVLVATTFRNIILWFPWAWICYNSIRKEIIGRSEK